MTNSKVSSELIAYIADFLSVDRSSLNEHTKLYADLRLDGDDAEEFLLGFSNQFNVDLSEFDFNKHFGEEAGFNPFYYLYCLFFNRQLMTFDEITLKDLQSAIDNGMWQE